MTAGTVEILPVEDLEELLGQSPPCEAQLNPFIRCGRPSVVRITVICPNCKPYRCFLCSRCLGLVRAGNAYCNAARGCGRNDFAWTEC